MKSLIEALITAVVLLIVVGWSYDKGYHAGQKNMRDAILCVTAHSMGHTYSAEARHHCVKLGTPIAPLKDAK